MKKTINLNKKVILILVIINLLLIGLNYSYALFETTIRHKDFLKIQSGNTDITTTIENYSDNLITLSSGESKTLNITLTNESSDYDILYKMYYTVESGEGLILVTDATSDTSGTMKGEKSLSLTIQNNNASDLSIKIETIGALLMEEITLLDGQYELIGDTDAPVVTVSAVSNNTTSPKLKITSNEDGEYCVNTSSTITNMSNCIFSGNITANTSITTGAFTTATTYYVHVKDNAGNIGISSKVAIDCNYIASTFASKNYGTGGLVAVNTSGTLYSGSGTIREYRYSGATANNYVFFDTDGDSVQDTNEIWRIIGIFKNSSGNWNFKLMRNRMLTSAELPGTYTYNGTSHKIENSSTGRAYWNYTKTGTNYNDWTTAGLQYYLNGTNGYFGTLSSGAQALVDKNYTYYLGNVGVSSTEQDTTINAYTHERGTKVCNSSVLGSTYYFNCNIWYGNKATWSKSSNSTANGIALLYPSDYGYSASSTYWSGTPLYTYSSTLLVATSWMFETANHSTTEWMLSPSSENSDQVASWDNSYGYVTSGDLDISGGVRPVLNLLSTAPIDANHQGTSSDPYILIVK